MTEWPFDLWLKYAVKALHLTPSCFWNMSVHDWLVLSAHEGGASLKREHLDSLMQNFPDIHNDEVEND